MAGMFVQTTAFNQDIGDWDVSSVLDMDEMFAEATAFNQDIGDWKVISVLDMDGMFKSATAFDQDISRWDVRSVNTCIQFAVGTLAPWTPAERPDLSSCQ